MSDEYISREAALKALYADYAYPAMGIIKEIPAADVAPVVHGRWISWEEAGNFVPSPDRHECSVCHDAAQVLVNGFELLSDYCPGCGAKMDGGDGMNLKEIFEHYTDDLADGTDIRKEAIASIEQAADHIDEYKLRHNARLFAIAYLALTDESTATVVRCKDCKYRTENGNCGHPRHHGILPSAYPCDFCSYGERRDGVDNKEQRRCPNGNDTSN